MVRRDWTYQQAREHLETPATVMRWRAIILDAADAVRPAPSADPVD